MSEFGWIAMPHFYFDIDDGQRRFGDDEGADYASAEDARKELVGSLAAIAKDKLPDGNIRDFSGSVRDDTRILFNAKLLLRSGWVESNERQALDIAIQECRHARANLGERGSFRSRVLLDMLLIELGKDLAQLPLEPDTTASPEP